MAKQVGVMNLCERCGKQVFKEYANKHLGNDIYVNAEYFESPPGWELIIGVGDVCPECRRYYMDMLERHKASMPNLVGRSSEMEDDLK